MFLVNWLIYLTSLSVYFLLCPVADAGNSQQGSAAKAVGLEAS